MNGLSLCSGIGGIDIGLAFAIPSYRTVCYVEIERARRDVLRARMADRLLHRAPIWRDLTTFDGRRWRGRVDIVHGGYPCQPFSGLGKGLGAADPRYLWTDIRDNIVSQCQPEWCFFENVARHLSRGAPDVVRDLVDLGYRVAAGVFTAAEVGAPHRRERLFILAHAPTQHQPPKQEGNYHAAWGSGGSTAVEGVPRHATVGYPQFWPPRRNDPAWRDIIEQHPELAPGRPAQPRVRGGAHGLPHRVDEDPEPPRHPRLRALGNAVLPPVAALAWLELVGGLRRAHSVHGLKEEVA
jgi:DNA (cytosine-5)-methyltransferase 1